MNNNSKVLNWKFNIAESPHGIVKQEFEASTDDLKQLARDLNINEVRSLKVDYDVEPWQKTGFRVTGWLRAAVEQDCIVSLTPVETLIEEKFSINFVPESEGHLYEPEISSEGVIEIDYFDSDPPDLFQGTEIDLGKLAEEQLALNLPAFPRAIDAEFSHEISNQGESGNTATEQDSPFAVLANLKSPRDAQK